MHWDRYIGIRHQHTVQKDIEGTSKIMTDLNSLWSKVR